MGGVWLTGQEDDYRALKQLLEPIAAVAPVYIGLGNHDDRSNFFKVFPTDDKKASPLGGKQVAVIERGDLRFIVLDSLLYVDEVAGLLGQAQRAWLAKFLEDADERPTLLFVHHTLGDGDGDLLDVDRLFRIIPDAFENSERSNVAKMIRGTQGCFLGTKRKIGSLASTLAFDSKPKRKRGRKPTPSLTPRLTVKPHS